MVANLTFRLSRVQLSDISFFLNTALDYFFSKVKKNGEEADDGKQRKNKEK